MTVNSAAPPGTTAGAYREQIWTALLRARACGYPVPPHGHHPNFTHARRAAHALLTHPEVAALRVLVVGPERALLPLRTLALRAGLTVYVPHQKKEGWYWRLTDVAGARLSAMPAVGEAVRTPDGAQGAVLACVAVDGHGARLSKGFGWGARGLHLGVPEYTLAHPLMMTPALPCPADSRVALIGTPGGVIAAQPRPEP
ncbi:5-formyltetrahydrofolate cyclo-ligase [uncultured Deinococcus sp.]|uniref:5-formyltetrahydrofolate cyclo-ligase n=1 Tax=uncultured Deinococcus sp. TaxID=158789 RepID=UPI0025D4B2F8|nr:5-formyltetrahydrofolate cyclo-ligase [uncultured Deinococcus sp.]